MKRQQYVLAVLAAFGLATVSGAQAQPPAMSAAAASSSGDRVGSPNPVVALSLPHGAAGSLSEKLGAEITGMQVETPDGKSIGKVKDVFVDGYGRATYAVISHGGFMGFGMQYSAVPWATAAPMIQGDKLRMDRSQLERAPVMASAKRGSSNATWSREADSYWRGNVPMQPASHVPSAGAGAAAPKPQLDMPPKEST